MMGVVVNNQIKLKKKILLHLIAEWDNVEGLTDDDTNNKLSIKLTPEKVIKLFRRISA